MIAARKKTPKAAANGVGGNFRFERIVDQPITAETICQSPIQYRDPRTLKPAPQNEQIYKKITARNVQSLRLSIRKHGIMEPLVITLDGVVPSGNRRLKAALLEKLDVVPVRVYPIRSDDPEFTRLLVEFNNQRVKTADECFRESLVQVDPAAIRKYRAEVIDRQIDLGEHGQEELTADRVTDRAKISAAKRPFADAIIKTINQCKSVWPISARGLFYMLLNILGLLRTTPVKGGKKAGLPFENNPESYKDMCDVLARCRLAGEVEWRAIHDETRKKVPFSFPANPKDYFDKECKEFLADYRRDCLQSQPDYVEVVCEKHTLEPVIRPVCAEFGVPILFSRGSSSVDARYQLVKRWKSSGKNRLVILALGDLDPAGEDIVQALVNSLYNDFGLEDDILVAHKVALTGEQVDRYHLPRSMLAKEKSSGFARFRDKNGEYAFELEALPAATLREILRASIIGVLDVVKYNSERKQEENDLVEIIQLREKFAAFWRAK